MEDIALAALPQEVDDTVATDPNSANKSEAPSVHSKGTSSSLSDLMVYPISRTSTVDYSESLLRASITRNVDNDLLKDHVGMLFNFDGLDPGEYFVITYMNSRAKTRLHFKSSLVRRHWFFLFLDASVV